MPPKAKQLVTALYKVACTGRMAECSPYQTVQEYLAGAQSSYRASVLDARQQLLELQLKLRSGMYSTYLEQCSAVSPAFEERGRRLGERILTEWQREADPHTMANVEYSKIAREATERQRLSSRAAAAGSLSSFSSDTAVPHNSDSDMLLDVLDAFAAPFLAPFTAGVKQPFLQAYEQHRTQTVKTIVATALGGLAAGAVGGFLLGRLTGSRKR